MRERLRTNTAIRRRTGDTPLGLTCDDLVVELSHRAPVCSGAEEHGAHQDLRDESPCADSNLAVDLEAGRCRRGAPHPYERHVENAVDDGKA